uniref:Selectin E n=1 Tax=Echeneis naucrates TaxID=173247 RepID=A0A665VI70_ECHNA
MFCPPSSVLCMWTSVESWSYYYSNSSMKWIEAREWCRTHYTDMVAIQNQDEIAYLNSWLPKQQNYYWIGIRKVNDVWTWVGTNKALTKEATNWAEGEPNNGSNGRRKRGNEDCVEMYIKRDLETGKWNDERCEKSKTALCYAAACKDDSCLNGECVETINSHMCVCFEGFYGERCEHAVTCDKEEITAPHKGNVSCTHKYGDFSYDSSCEYSCEEGYKLSVSSPLKCSSTGEWSAQPPTCELVQCPELSDPIRGSMKCSDPLGPSSYQTTCVFTCDEGYVQVGSPSNTLQCEASGTWNASQPSCVLVECPALPELDNGLVSCKDIDMKFAYGNACSFSCFSGYDLVGESKLTCTASAEWSDKMPRCEVVRCPLLDAPENGHINCSDNQPEYTSQCSFTCSQGYTLDGNEQLTCSHRGNWTGERPVCNVSPSDVTVVASGVAAGGALLSVLSAVMWIMRRLKKKATKFELNR